MTNREPSHVETSIAQHLELGMLADAATAAIRGYGPEILGYLSAVLRDRDAASDVFAQFSEDLWKGIAGFRKESTFRTWAYKLAWNACRVFKRDPFRRRVHRLESREYSQVLEGLRASSLRGDPLIADRLAKARETLEPDEQTLLILRVEKDLSWKQIAGVLGRRGAAPEATALRKRFERLKERLVKLAGKPGLLDSGTPTRAGPDRSARR